MNPKKFNPNNLEKTVLHHDNDGDFFILPAHSYGLGLNFLGFITVPGICLKIRNSSDESLKS